MPKFPAFLALIAVLTLSACGTYSTGSVAEAPGTSNIGSSIQISPEQIFVTQNDITNRRYVSLGDISVTVRKITLFDSDPTPEKVNQALRERAAELGADAVVLVRYGSVGIGMLSWGQLDGKGRAVKFQ